LFHNVLFSVFSETDLDEVLHTEAVFTNVSKGILAKSQELKKHFGTDNVRDVCLFILQKGELQISEVERKSHQETLLRDIATIVAEKCFNTETNRPLTVGVVERAIKEIHYSVNPHKSAKQQALHVIKLLQEKGNLPIARAKMRLQLTIPTTFVSAVKEKLQTRVAVWESEQLASHNNTGTGNSNQAVIIQCQIEPKYFREVNQLVLQETQKTGNVEVLVHAVMPGQDISSVSSISSSTSTSPNPVSSSEERLAVTHSNDNNSDFDEENPES
jgi:ribosome maturation protein SDO1